MGEKRGATGGQAGGHGMASASKQAPYLHYRHRHNLYHVTLQPRQSLLFLNANGSRACGGGSTLARWSQSRLLAAPPPLLLSPLSPLLLLLSSTSRG